ncbi:hypothetical protein [Thiorhodococcus fuscus]|uniref:Uncharacterized protein n=1 Tax=Thiorhodococcus fuscus TaxID=527200 RepID=A0ABW4Y7C3_9GAMM
MTDAERIVWGALAGVSIYIVGQLLSKFLIEPLHELRKTVGEVRFNLAFYAPTIHTPIGRSKEASADAQQALRENSCNLISKLHAVPIYSVVRHLSFGVLPERKAIEKAAAHLRALSTYVLQEGEKANNNSETVEKLVLRVELLLNLKPLE